MQNMLNFIRKPDPSTLITSQFPFEKLPEDIKLNVVKYLAPVDAINFEAASHRSRDLIANNVALWKQHGGRPSASSPGTLKQAWMCRFKLLSPQARAALPRLEKHLDLSSDETLWSLSDMFEYIDWAQSNLIKGDMPRMATDLVLAFRDSKNLNIELPPLSLKNVNSEAKIIYFETLEELKSEA
ncbi:MAG: F-box domain-containing protein [Cytophagaceae bacterium]|nr:MAG: F-box domain-containing protein [Cytophagaceae bacterium]